MGDTGRHMGLFPGRMDGRAYGRFGGRHGRSVVQKKINDWDTDFLLFWEQTVATPESWMRAYNKMFKSLKDAALFQKADVIYVFSGHNEYDSRISLIGDGRMASAVNSPSFNQKRGFSGNGSTSYLNSNYNAKNHSVKYSKDDSGIMVNTYVTFSNGVLFGIYDGAYIELAILGSRYWALNGALVADSCANESGTFSVARIALNYYHYSASYSNVASTPSTYIPDGDVYILARNRVDISSVDFFSTAKISAIAFGSSFLNEDRISFDSIINQFKSEIADL